MYRAVLPKTSSLEHWLLTGHFDVAGETRCREEMLDEEEEAAEAPVVVEPGQ